MKRGDKHLLIAGGIIGLGIMGLVDGIVFHQLLEWHHVVHGHNHRMDLISDGIFNLAVTIIVLYGVIRVFQHARRDELSSSWTFYICGMLIGAGIFNLAEGLINHQILELHHVRPGHPAEFMYDMLYLLSGVILIAIGGTIAQYRGGRSVPLEMRRKKAEMS